MREVQARPEVRPVPAVSAAVVRDGRILMVRRRNPPNAGMLALPGGKVEPGESLQEAAVRELLEETGVHAIPREVLTAIDLLDHGGDGELLSHYVIVVVRMAWLGGTEVAADDATELRWMDATMLEDDHGEISTSAGTVARCALEALTAETALRTR